jgi:hypothetical protein
MNGQVIAAVLISPELARGAPVEGLYPEFASAFFSTQRAESAKSAFDP